MTKQKEYTEVRLQRKSYGRFTEDLLKALTSEITHNGRTLVIESFELGDDPVNEKVELRFHLQPHVSTGEPVPSLFFSFTSEVTIKKNLAELRQFIDEFAETASRRLSIPTSATAEGHTR